MDQIVLVLITFIAATVNGALGYGFSSITVPVALLFYTNRILNPGRENHCHPFWDWYRNTLFGHHHFRATPSAII